EDVDTRVGNEILHDLARLGLVEVKIVEPARLDARVPLPQKTPRVIDAEEVPLRMLRGALEQKAPLAAPDLHLEGLLRFEEIEHGGDIELRETTLGAPRTAAPFLFRVLKGHAAIIANVVAREN